MGLQINLYVHGVPMGQKIWGPKGGDEMYLSSFYGPKWDVPEVLKIDIMTFGGMQYCYYSFIKGQNVCDSQGRAGSYFALTLRINAFYADVQNMYNILKAAYDKMCVGLCVQENNGTIKYTISDFQNVDAELQSIEKHLITYISEFSVNSDIILLSGMSANTQVASQSINLFECSKSVANEWMKKTGKLMVSSYYLSSSVAKTLAQYKAEMQAASQKAQQEIQLQQKANQDKITEITRQCDERIDSVIQKSKQELITCQQNSQLHIDEIKQQYLGVDNEIAYLKQSIKAKDNEISRLNSICKNKDKEIRSCNSANQQLQQRLYNLQRGFNCNYQSEKKDWTKWIIIASVIILSTIMVGLFTYFVINIFTDKSDDVNNEIVQETKMDYDFIVPILPKYSIEVEEMTEDISSISVGEMWHISLVGQGSEALDGKWESDYFEIMDNTIIPKRECAGKFATISFVVNDSVVAKKEIRIEEEKDK